MAEDFSIIRKTNHRPRSSINKFKNMKKTR